MNITKAFSRAVLAVGVAAGLSGATSAQAASPVEKWGNLYVCDKTQWVDGAQRNVKKICGNGGAVVTLRGPSLFWSVWGGEEAFKRAVVSSIKNDWQADVIRVPIAVDNYGEKPSGALDYSNESTRTLNGQFTRAVNMVNWAQEQGLYVIIDFHSHRMTNQNNRNEASNRDLRKLAGDFFYQLAKRFPNSPNLIYETWNEPCKNSGGPCDYGWSYIKDYHNHAIGSIQAGIRDGGGGTRKPLVIAGTPDWSSRLNVLLNSNGTKNTNAMLGYSNALYAFHFYAASHSDSYKGQVNNAFKAGIPIFVSEYGCTTADGQSGFDATKCNDWQGFLNQFNIGHARWAVTRLSGETAMLKSWVRGPQLDDGIQLDERTTQGNDLRGYLRGKKAW